MLRTIGILIGISLAVACYSTYAAGTSRSEIKVTDLKANSGLAYEVDESLEVGDKEYTDRDYTFTDIPDYLLGLTWIRTANNDKKNPNLEVSFKIDREAYVYILWIARDPANQDWLQKNYVKTGDIVNSTDEPLAVYKSKKPFPPGEVKTYAANTGAGMYVIVLEPTGKKAAVKPQGKIAVTWAKIKASR